MGGESNGRIAVSESWTNGSGGPWWAKALYMFGVPAGIALYLVWFLTSGAYAALNRKLDEHVTRTNFYLRAICLNTAPTDVARAQCLSKEVE